MPQTFLEVAASGFFVHAHSLHLPELTNPGLTLALGALAVWASALDGNADTGDMSIASRLTHGAGSWSHSFGLAGEYSRGGKTTTEGEFFGAYEANRYFSDRFYVFGLGRCNYWAVMRLSARLGMIVGWGIPLRDSSDPDGPAQKTGAWTTS